jgi:integrase
MPLKLIPPSKERRTPYYSVRGTLLGIYLDRSTKTGERKQAVKVKREWEEQIKRGEYRSGPPIVEKGPEAEMTFAGAAIAYMNAGGEKRFLTQAIEQLGREPLSKLDQTRIDAGAVAAFPTGTAAYRNRNFYTPVSAVLKHVGIDNKLKRPKGWRGKRHTTWLEPAQAFALFKAADKVDAEFGLFLRYLCYTGMRLGEALNVRIRHVNLERQAIYLPEPKNGEARSVFLPAVLVTALANHPRGLNRPADQKLFRFGINGRTRDMLKQAKKAAGIVLPFRQGGFHMLSHTWATWMRRYGKLDTYDLVDTGRWKDPASARRYAHTEPTETARMADLLPVEKRTKR